MKNLFRPLLILLALTWCAPVGAQTTPVLFSLLNLTGTVNNRVIHVRPDTLPNQLPIVGTNLVETAPFDLQPVHGQVLTNLVPWGYSLQVDGWSRVLHINVPSSTNVQNAASLVSTNYYSPLTITLTPYVGTNGISLVTNTDGSITISGFTLQQWATNTVLWGLGSGQSASFRQMSATTVNIVSGGLGQPTQSVTNTTVYDGFGMNDQYYNNVSTGPGYWFQVSLGDGEYFQILSNNWIYVDANSNSFSFTNGVLTASGGFSGNGNLLTNLVGQIIGWANLQNFIGLSIRRDSNEVVTNMALTWPDGATGVFTTTSNNPTFHTIDAYTVTYTNSNGTTHGFTQPTILRDSTGAATNVPSIVQNY